MEKKNDSELRYFDVLKVDPEIARLAKQHVVMKDAMGGYLLEMRSELPAGPLRILDSATADGHWLRDLASTFPADSGNEYVGTDLDISRLPVHPTTADDPHWTWASQDVNEPWPAEWQGTFDLVHQRLTLLPASAAGDKGRAAIERLVGLLKPGGWLQLCEAENRWDGTDGPAVKQMLSVMASMMAWRKADHSVPDGIKGWVEGAGMVDVHERFMPVHWGRNDDPNVADQGREAIHDMARNICGLLGSDMMPEDDYKTFITMSKDDIKTLPDRLEEELRERGGNFAMRVIWAKKPSNS